MAQTWRELLFAHWAVDPEVLGRVMPPQLRPDVREGSAWLAVTPFRVEGFRLRGLPPLPFASGFLEVNVRTYVTVDGRPGIYFFSLDANSRLAVRGARLTYRLPYFRSRMSMSHGDGAIEMRAARASPDGPAAELVWRYRPDGAPLPRRRQSLERWLTERYCLYTLDDRGVIQRGEIHHPPWSLQPAMATIKANSMAGALGVTLEGDPLLHYAERQDVVLWAIEPA